MFLKENKKSYFVVLDVPLLYETGSHRECDYIFLVNTSRKNQKKRVLTRPHMTEKKFNQINNTQWSFERKKSKNPFIIRLLSKSIQFYNCFTISINYNFNKVYNGKRISSRH